MATVIYHNPRCSKSRQTLELLHARGLQPEIVEYLKNPPTPETVRDWVEQLGIAAHSLLRTNEAAYATLGLSAASGVDEVAQAIANHPSLLQRPLVVHEGRAVIARPPELVLEIL